MYIATNEARTGEREVMDIMPQRLKKYLCSISFEGALEIRVTAGKPLAVRYTDGWYYLSKNGVLSSNAANAVRIADSDMDELIEKVTKSSLYSVRDELRNGYITIEGGHRIGIAGTAVTENGAVEFIKSISAVNIRLAHEVIGAADGIIKRITENGLKSTLIISPPCGGKTTMLRDIARQLSDMGYSVAVADERCEIAAMYNGRSSFDIGNMTVVTDNCPKEKAMLMLLRSMSPDVVITDEIGTYEDAKAIQNIINSGVAVMASIHGRDTKQLMKRKQLKTLASLFDIIAVLSDRNGAGTIEEIAEND